MQVLICDALSFMRPYLQKVELTDSIRTLYKGLLCILLVLLHDFPSFLCQYHFAFCDLIPTTCVQMRNLVLSAFPRTMRLPDPFTSNLKVSELPEISIAPRILSDYVVSFFFLSFLSSFLSFLLSHFNTMRVCGMECMFDDVVVCS